MISSLGIVSSDLRNPFFLVYLRLLTNLDRSSLHKILYLSMLTFIGIVSLYDGYLVYAYRDTIWELEQNPIGRYLIELGKGDVFLFLLTKAAGTTLCLAILGLFYLYFLRYALPVISGVASAQTFLLCYLIFA